VSVHSGGVSGWPSQREAQVVRRGVVRTATAAAQARQLHFGA
jgi:hypothetical protein